LKKDLRKKKDTHLIKEYNIVDNVDIIVLEGSPLDWLVFLGAKVSQRGIDLPTVPSS